MIQSFSIAQAAPAFTFDLSALAAKAYGDAPFSVASYAHAPADDTGAVTFATGSGSVGCTVTSDGTVTITGVTAGTDHCIIEASLAADSNYLAAGPISQSISIAQAASTVTVNCPTPSPIYTGSQITGCTASATGADGLNQSLSVTYTGRNGTTYASSTTPPTNAGDYTASASFDGDATHAASSNSADFSIAQATPVITWSDPAEITYGTALSSTQLDATADVPGTFSYTPDSSTLLDAGTGQVLSVDFTPTDSTNYSGATATVHINVGKASQTINFTSAAPTNASDGGTYTPTATGGDSGNPIIFGASGACSYDSGTGLVTMSGTGNCTVTADQAGNTNYQTADQVSQSFSVTQGTMCAAGSYSTTGFAPCTPAPPGKFVDTTGATSATPCAVGTYQPVTGQTSCIDAPAGSYVDTTGAISATLCSAGTYQDQTGQSSCLAAPAGSFVDTAGSTQATLCSAGYYQPATGQSSCLPADPNYFVPTSGATSETPCPNGTHQPDTAQTSCIPDAVYTIKPLFDQTEPHRSGSVILVRLQLLDANGVNVSSRNLTVTAIDVDGNATLLQTAGRSNPDNVFRFVGHQYLLILKTTGLAAGTHTLHFTVSGDSTVYDVTFVIKSSRNDHWWSTLPDYWWRRY